MASAEAVYVDPSALRRQYVHDQHSRAFCSWRARKRGALLLTLHGRSELVNSICLGIFREDIDRSAGEAALADLDEDLAAGRLILADVPWRRVFERAEALSRAHTPKLGTRTLDVLHVASALVLGCRQLVTYDERQALLARAAGLRLARP